MAAKKLTNKNIPVPNTNFINQIEECLNTYRHLMSQINFTKHPAELELAVEQVNQILLKHATCAHADVLDYLGKYITFDYISQWEKDELDNTQE